MRSFSLIILTVFLSFSCSRFKEDYRPLDSNAPLFPDYANVLFPPNIAAPNFLVEDNAEKHFVKIYAQSGDTIFIHGKSNIRIPLKKWKKLLSANHAKPLFFEIYSQTDSGWIKYRTIENRIDDQPIDSYLVYRLVAPGNASFRFLGIYERNLTNYDERLIVSNKQTHGCVNCHTFNQNNPNSMLIHFRIVNAGVLKIQGDSVRKIDNSKTADLNIKLTYPAWHPSEKYIAFATNQVNPFTHVEPHLRFDGTFDTLSDIVLYDIAANTVIHYPELSLPDQEENFPAWTPNGKQLYFCRMKQAKRVENSTMEHMLHMKYDLFVSDFDEDTKSFSEPRRVINASENGKSINLIRITNDGRFLMYCESNSNGFPTIQESADLRLLNLETGAIDSLTLANSAKSESYHSWSSDSRWFVFSSKRYDGNYVQLYLAKVNGSGMVSKPFVLPQKEGTFYKAYLRSYNIPELIKAPIPGSTYEFLQNSMLPAEPTEHEFMGDNAYFRNFPKASAQSSRQASGH